MKRTLCITLALLIALLGVIPLTGSAMDLPAGVTDAMCRSDYWKARTVTDADKVLMTDEEILALNQAGIDGRGTYIFDIENMGNFDGAAQQAKLSATAPAGKSLYQNGEKLNITTYYEKLNIAIHTTGFTATDMEPLYAVIVAGTELRDIPTDLPTGYSATDPDDQLLSESLTVNEPFLVKGKCTVDEKIFYYGYTLDCTGWISGEDLAICKDKAEWLDAWKGDIDGKDFVVVTTDKIQLEKAVLRPNASELKLRMGTLLKLVPQDKIPAVVGERGTWNNYIVYIPIRNEDGSYAKEIAMISQHCKVSVGYLDLTQGNILDVAFECLGNTYGWAGWLDSYDCSMYVRYIYRCFGINIPRNTTYQQKVPNTKYDLSAMNDGEKQKFIEALPVGSLLFMSGHVVMYLGSENGTGYVISALGKAADSVGEPVVKDIYSICVTPLTVRRNAANNNATWLTSLISAVVLVPPQSAESFIVTAQTKCTDTDYKETVYSVKLGNLELTENVHYTAEQQGCTLRVKGTGYFTGEKQVAVQNPHVDQNENDKCDNCKCYLSGNFFTHLLFIIRNMVAKVFVL